MSARLLSAILGAVITIVMSRSLGVADYAVFALATSIATIGVGLSDAGMNTLVVRESISSPSLERSLVSWSVTARLCLGSVVAGVSSLGLYFMVDDLQQWLACTAIVASLPVLALSIRISTLNRRYRLDRVALLSFVQTAFWFVAVVALSLLPEPKLLYYGIGYLVSIVVYGWLIVVLTRSSIPALGVELSLRDAMRKLLPAIPLGLGAMITIVYAKIGGVIVFNIDGSHASGEYAVASRVIDQLSLLPMTVGMIFSPALNYFLRGGLADDVAAISRQWARVVSSMGLLTSAAVASAAPLVVPLLFGNEFSGAVGPLQTLSAAFVFVCLGWMLTPMVIAYRLIRAQLYAALGGFIACVLLSVVLVQSFGALGAAIATVLTELVVVCVLLMWLSRSGNPIGFDGSLVTRLAMVVLVLGSMVLFLPPSWFSVLGTILTGAVLLGVLRLLEIGDLRLELVMRSRRVVETELPAGLD